METDVTASGNERQKAQGAAQKGSRIQSEKDRDEATTG